MANEVAVVGEVRVDLRSHDLGEIFNLRERILEVNDRKYRDERGPFVFVERLHLLVPGQQRVDGFKVGGNMSESGQIVPGKQPRAREHAFVFANGMRGAAGNDRLLAPSVAMRPG